MRVRLAGWILLWLAPAVFAADAAPRVEGFARALMTELSVEAMDCSARSIVLDGTETSTRIEGSSLPDVSDLKATGMRAVCGYRLHTDRDRFQSLWDGRLRGTVSGVTALPEGPWEELGGGLTGRAYRVVGELFTVGIGSMRGQDASSSLSGVMLIFLFEDAKQPPSAE
jgi:hypothetical protein